MSLLIYVPVTIVESIFWLFIIVTSLKLTVQYTNLSIVNTLLNEEFVELFIPAIDLPDNKENCVLELDAIIDPEASLPDNNPPTKLAFFLDKLPEIVLADIYNQP